MSTLYNLEPQPTAKVILHTTSGDIALELFAHQTPLASRNFLQLCLDGYYDRTIFHRLVPGFVLQGGDPTGTGSGGESSFDGGKPFTDEFHSRLKFNRRGLLGMAYTGTKNDNGSQFFLTLGPTPELTGRNTMFGRVEGDTIFNLVKMGEAELAEEEGSERPMYPTTIIGTEILVNPFSDMEKRSRTAERPTEPAQVKKKPTKRAAKTLLSFGGDEDEDSAPTVISKINKALAPASQGSNSNNLKRPAPAPASAPAPKRRKSPSPSEEDDEKDTAQQPPQEQPRSTSSSPSPPPSKKTKDEILLARANAKIEELRSSLKRTVATPAAGSPRQKSALEAMIPATAMRGRKRRPVGASGLVPSREESRTLDALNAFRRKLDAAPVREDEASPDRDVAGEVGQQQDLNGQTGQTVDATNGGAGEEDVCDLHFIANCQSCRNWDEAERAADQDDDDDTAWMSHKLSFGKDRFGKDLAWKRQHEDDGLVVIDPREKEKEFQAERKEKKNARDGPWRR